MSVLTVKNISHGFGDRAIFEDVSFRLLKGEHVGLIGANGEGKSTFMNIITSKLMPDEGKVIWSNRVRVGYMDQHAELAKGLTIRDVLRSAFQYLFDMETEMNELYGRMGEMDEDEMNKALGLIKSNQNKDDYYAKIDKEFSKDPIAFAEKYASPEVIEHAQASTTDFDICGTLARTLSPERQAKIVEGFSQRNESPRAFTGEFLDLFTATA